jgi:predicted nucleic acid-binding protein
MTDIPGNKTVVVDSDALIGLIHEDDLLHTRSVKVASYLAKNGFATIVPGPIILEAATTLAKDKTINRPDLAKRLLKDYAGIEPPSLTSKIFKELARNYSARTSKQNTPFDYLVVATAKLQGIKTVFSFDKFYQKQGLTLAEELLLRA